MQEQNLKEEIVLKKLVLFDIDGTLIKNTIAHKTAFSTGFKEVYGIDASIDSIRHHGLTDQQIIREIALQHGITEQLINKKIKDCMRIMVNSFKKAIEEEEIHLLPGVKELLKALHRKDILLGLVTGNLQPIAEGKLKKASIYHYFKVGGFGSDSPDRAIMLKIAIERATKMIGNIPLKSIFLFGDTIYDINAGKRIGVNTVAVATGSYSKEMLKEADIVLPSLQETQKITQFIMQT